MDVIREEINKTERFLYFVLLLWHNLVGLDELYDSAVKKYYFIQTIGPFIFFLFHPSFIWRWGETVKPSALSLNMEWCKWSNVITLLRTIFITALFALFVQQSFTAFIKYLEGKTSYHTTLKVVRYIYSLFLSSENISSAGKEQLDVSLSDSL